MPSSASRRENQSTAAGAQPNFLDRFACGSGCGQSRARAGRDASLRRSASPTALRCSVPWPRRQLTSRASRAAFKQSRRSRRTRRAEARWPCALRSSAPHRRVAACPGPALPRRSRCSHRTPPMHRTRVRRHPAGAICAAARSAAPGSARCSAPRDPTRRYCLNAAPGPKGLARSELSARPRGEHRSAVGAKRRPPQHEPLAGAAWRDAPAGDHDSGLSWAAAMRRQRLPEPKPWCASALQALTSRRCVISDGAPSRLGGPQ